MKTSFNSIKSTISISIWLYGAYYYRLTYNNRPTYSEYVVIVHDYVKPVGILYLV
jgi:hypothetical protein